MGSNAALFDASKLRDTLVRVSQGAQLITALHTYERELIDHGFAAVRSSLSDMERLHSRSWLKRSTTKAPVRVVDGLPWLQRAFRGQR
jgi:2-polyprenyl-6-methoxyphenol hydroxylase-like FAD-dependent oxidoreductase